MLYRIALLVFIMLIPLRGFGANEFKHASVGAEMSQDEWEAVNTHTLDSIATGDMIYANGSILYRLAIGTNDMVMTVVSGSPAWVAHAAGLALTGGTMTGDLIINADLAVNGATALTGDAGTGDGGNAPAVLTVIGGTGATGTATTAGDGAGPTLTGGDGGAGGTGEDGGAGGPIAVTAGDGGAAATSTGGIGGAVSITSGSGGVGPSVGANGGAVAITSGDGGSSVGGGGGNAGTITITTGDGADGGSGTGGDGGDLVFAPGTGSAIGGAGPGSDGVVRFAADADFDSNRITDLPLAISSDEPLRKGEFDTHEADVDAHHNENELNSLGGTHSGVVTVNPTGAIASNVPIGVAGVDGADILWTAGEGGAWSGSAVGAGGDATVIAGVGGAHTTAGTGGVASLIGGAGGADDGDGGGAVVQGGAGTDGVTAGHGADVTLQGGVGGDGSGTNGSGGDIVLNPGNPGAGGGTAGSTGEVKVTTGRINMVAHVLMGLPVPTLGTEPVLKSMWDAIFGALNEPTGFPTTTLSTLSFNSPTRELTVSPTGADFDVWQQGIQYTLTADVLATTDVSGMHIFYYDLGVLSVIVNPSHDQVDDLILNKVTAMSLYWNATDNAAYVLGEERHGTNMSGASHHYHHDSDGTRYNQGFTMYDYLVDTTSDVALTFKVVDGRFYDEDLEIDVIDGSPGNQYEQILNVTDASIPILYRDDIDGTWTEDAATNLPYKSFGASRLAYNNDDGDGTFSQIEIGDNKFVVMSLIASNDWQYPVKAIQGQQEYDTEAEALLDANSSIIAIGDYPAAEAVLLYRVILNTKSSYSGTKKAQIVSVTDYRASTINGAAATSQDHGALSGLPDDDHAQYLLRTEFNGPHSETTGRTANDHHDEHSLNASGGTPTDVVAVDGVGNVSSTIPTAADNTTGYGVTWTAGKGGQYAGGPVGVGGAVNLIGGKGGDYNTAGDGGNVAITAGAGGDGSVANGDGGDVVVTPGVGGSGGGTVGAVGTISLQGVTTIKESSTSELTVLTLGNSGGGGSSSPALAFQPLLGTLTVPVRIVGTALGAYDIALSFWSVEGDAGSPGVASEAVRIGPTGSVSIGNGVVSTDPGAGNLLVENSVLIQDALQMLQRTGDPTPVTDTAFVYGKDGTHGAEVWVEDESGNASEISPHDADGYWRFFSSNAFTGEVLIVHTERLMKALDAWYVSEHPGTESFIEEYTTGTKISWDDWATSQALRLRSIERQRRLAEVDEDEVLPKLAYERVDVYEDVVTTHTRYRLIVNPSSANTDGPLTDNDFIAQPYKVRERVGRRIVGKRLALKPGFRFDEATGKCYRRRNISLPPASEFRPVRPDFIPR